MSEPKPSNVVPHPAIEKKEWTPPFATRIVQASGLAERTPTEQQFIVNPIIPVGLVTLIAGPSGVGKSILCQQLITACAAEREWLGFPVHGCRSFAMFTEDAKDHLDTRQYKMCEYYGIEPVDFEDKVAWIPDDHQDPALFTSPAKWNYHLREEPLWQALKYYCLMHEIGLLILDNYHTVYAGDDGNRHQIKHFFRLLHAAAAELQLAIVLLHHPPKDRTKGYFSGLQQIENSLRHCFSLSPVLDAEGNETSDLLFRAMPGSNYIRNDHPLRRHGLPLRMTDGIIEVREIAVKPMLGQFDRIELDNRVLAALRYIIDVQRGKVSPDPHSRDSLWARLHASPKWRGTQRWEVEGSVERLREAGRLVEVKVKRTWLIRPEGCRYLGEP